MLSLQAATHPGGVVRAVLQYRAAQELKHCSSQRSKRLFSSSPNPYTVDPPLPPDWLQLDSTAGVCFRRGSG